jgi:uncharacterized phage protein (TIGR02216 family)
LNAAAARPAATFPWEEVLAFGLGRLRLTPEALWATTPLELAAAWRAFAGPATRPPDRNALDALMARFPD